MPQAIAFIIVGFQVSFLTGVGAIFTALGPILQVALSIGLSLASALLGPKPPKPEDVQSNIRQSTPTRGALYGRGLIGGPWVFAGTKNGEFHKVIASSSRPLSSINDIWVDDNIVTLDEDGWVTDPPEYTRDGVQKLRILTRSGEPTETYYSELETFFPEWTSSHRGDGVASLYARQRAVKPEAISKVFPNIHNTLYRTDANGVVLFDPTDEAHDIEDDSTWTYSDNLARIVMDYLWHQDGMRVPVTMLTTDLALEGWQQAVDDCNDEIALKAGGTEPRYRTWCYYQYSERPADVLRRMLETGAAKLKPTPDGGLTIDVGKWREPTVTINETHIKSFDGVGRGKDILQTANTFYATFTSPDHQFQTTDADPWIDDADVAERGEIATDIPLPCSPSHGQTRRLMKIKAHAANPEWVGTFVLNKDGLICFGERFINLEYPLFGIDGTFEVLDFSFVLGEHSTIVGCTITVQSMTEAAFTWDAATEEGTAPPFESIDEASNVPEAGTFTATLINKVSGGVSRAYALLEWEAPPDPLYAEVRGKQVDDTDWTTIVAASMSANGQTSAEWELTEDGEDYEFEVRYVSALSSEGEWVDSTPPTLTAVSDPDEPDAVTGVSATGGVGEALIEWVAPNSANYVGASIRRNAADDEGAATLVRVEYGAASSADSWTDTGLAAGTYYYWIKARNASGVESAASAATGAVTVT